MFLARSPGYANYSCSIVCIWTVSESWGLVSIMKRVPALNLVPDFFSPSLVIALCTICRETQSDDL